MKTWEEAVSHLRQLAKESEDFTMRIHELASAIQRMERDKAIAEALAHPTETKEVK